MLINRRTPARTPISAGILTPSMRAALSPAVRGTTNVRTDMSPMGTRRIPARTPITVGIGSSALRLPAGRSVRPPIHGDRPGAIASSTLATQSVFGGAQGGLGAATSPLGPTTLTAFSSSVGKAGTGIMNTLGSLVPLAIKVILAVIVIKIVLWLIKRRR